MIIQNIKQLFLGNNLTIFLSLHFKLQKIGISENISDILVTLLVLNDDKFISFNEEQL